MGKDKIPDAWDDDDWEQLADRAVKEEPPKPEPPKPLTRAERLAKHAEEQRKLWESAETSDDTPIFPPSANPLPFATPFKPAVKVLSRKPAPQVIAKKDPVTGLERLTLANDNDEDDEDDKKTQESPEEIRKRQQRELEEKQRRYEEARAKIFGDSNPSSGQSTPRTGTPPSGSDGRQSHRGRGRGRAGRGRDQEPVRPPERRQPNTQQSASTRELFDAGYSPKPGISLQKRGDSAGQHGSRTSTPRDEDQIIRKPRGPDGSGRGFGFARRGGEHG
ncbi:hypothetical protein N658DRAFT_503719 [Parathielavia hyrcaniae]|uniref:SUZ domain-containing protein n=1 Tax=Parathielavia hyrcaniae TaxID=113614 RepID=A0AAN6Q8J1_9PEZI|nr:hypothetical protein N658DRAFT_503719 [Parathielavia hyrcaniae]